MTIDKQALRERYSPKPVPECHICGEEMTIQRMSASRITYGCTGATYDDKGCHYAEGRSIADDHYEQSRVTVVDVSDPDVLALLDENLQLQREKDAIEAVALALRDDMRQAREQLEAAEKRIADGSKRIAELESNEVREVGNKFLVVRHPGKTPAIKHCTGDLEDFLRKLIEQDPLVTIDIITHRYYGVGGQWVQDAGEYLQMMQGAGIGVKQQEDSVDSDVGRNQPGMVVAVHIGAGDFVKFKGQVFEVEETDFDDHDVTLWFVGGNALKCAAGCPVEVVSAPVAAGIKVKES
ncbi:ead/Ea22-like family protein [Salmonella enterica]|uniref:Ead/Ea22-like family protein n=1 Tax=Salmonella enterica subsp. enterica serovar Braenderup TaxID=149391 RepID=A0A5W0KDS2_SALET|nr:ead/Ea22-like family protein [Salmonella enterica]EBV9201880.1 ead/Ea22-like family protein [Salmonella enterica subsp. enterica serovar Braenderup]ECQ0389619.1 ead/Ea22-like family protein [Salmonella enterica subsp. enterica serovar Newport]ECS8525056.1 ead/Ea22-like family protein [Salmonella enterica subsp. enterica serovar Bareilly]EAM5411940.1 ead/Ea22-like family protein [Salmonella enterica]